MLVITVDVPVPKENPLAPYSMLYELALLVPVHEISAELADILETCRLDGHGQLKHDNTSRKSIAISPVKDAPLL